MSVSWFKVKKRTPGPWRLGHASNGMPYVAGGSECVVSAGAVTEADARLIAAAPELARILERILRAHRSGNNGAVMGEATICEAFAMAAEAVLAQVDGGE